MACALAGCAGAPLPVEFKQAQERERARDDEGALVLWHQAAERCRQGATRSHDDCGLAVTREAQTLERLKRYADAFRVWQEVPKVTRAPRTAARALERAAVLAADELHDDAAAEKLAWAVVERFPDEVAAEGALDVAVRLGKRADPAALARRLAAVLPAVEHTDLGDNVLFEAAELHRAAGDAADALVLYDRIADEWLHSALRDDALFRGAELARGRGDARGALQRLQRLLDTRRDALITGSYNSLYLDDAQLLYGHICLDDLHDATRAADAFRVLADDFPESILKDDALVELARAQLARHAPPSDGDKRDACASLTRLLAKYPNSNKRAAATTMRDELQCPR